MKDLKFIQDTEVLDTFRISFEMEISNKVQMNNDEMIVFLKDGTKAKISTKSVQLKEIL